MGAILGFTGDYRFLSNFHLALVELDGVMYPSTENAYQAAKTLDVRIRQKFQSPCTPKEAKDKGRRISCLRADWEEVKISIMEFLVKQKFNNHPYLKDLLLKTGDVYLEETNWWNDRFWGVCKGEGKNHLGKIIMKVREELKNANPVS